MSLRSTIVLIFLFGLASARANLIVNGGFETTVSGTVSGNNVGTIPPNWTVVLGSAYSNLQINSASGVGGFTLLPHSGSQFFDGTGIGSFPNPPVLAFQDFTTTVGGFFEISVAWGGRDTGSNTTPSNFAILNTSNTVLYTGANVTVMPENWVVQNDTTSIYFGPGTYRFQINLSDPINVDDVSLIVVPEPSTYAAAFLVLGLTFWHWIKRRRRKADPAFDAGL